MAEFLSPDVYIEEVQGQSGQIPTASTSTFAMAGYSPRGPEGKAYINGSFKEFSDRFGGFSTKSYNAYCAAAFYMNGGNRLAFVRQLHSDATYATGSFPGTWNVRGSGRGVWANNAEITLSGNPSFYDQATATYSRFDVVVELIDSTTGLLNVSETFEAVDLTDTESSDYITKILEANSEDVVFTEIAGGIPAELQPIPFANILIGTGTGSLTNFSGTLTTQAPLAETTVQVKVDGTLVATDDGEGNMIGVSGGPTISGLVDYTTGDLSVTISPAPLAGLAVTVDGLTKPDASVTIALAGGYDGGAVISSDVVGLNLQPLKQGIYALDDFDEQMAIALPDFAGDAATDLSLISYAALRRDAVALIQPPKGSSPQSASNYKRNTLKSVSSYAAMYYPWVRIPDSLNRNRPKTIPPCGHAAGRFAFTDITENVGKAPAGVIRGQLSYIIDLERALSKTERDTVSQAQINSIRSDAQVGTAIWGNRTLQVVGDFTDINVRRLFIFLEKSQYAGLLDIVFENVGPVTFSAVKARLDAYLENLFLGGVIGSGVPDKSQAFKVICDETNNTPATQQAKKIIIDEWIKPNIAAEFIYLRLQKTFDASQI